MAKDRRKVQHIHSSVPDKQPTPASLEVGEIAVNNSKDQEFLSIKNSENKVVRFSSDEQMVVIGEKKEVMPYGGLVRGAEGASGAKDSYNSYGITESDLINNKSNIIIKLNQVAAGNTTKHDMVNGAKDIYDNPVNPTEDGGLNDGAGFAIDMSRYAMIGANPTFSSMTTDSMSTDSISTTCHAQFNGMTEILGGTETTGDCRSLLKIDVLTADTKAGSAKTEVTTNYDINVGGNTSIISSGNTVMHSEGAVGITAKDDITAISSESNIYLTANSNLCATAGDVATIYGEGVTNVGTNCNGAGASTNTNISGGTIGIAAGTLNENVSGDETINIGGDYVTNVGKEIQIASNSAICIVSNDVLNIGANNSTNIGVDCHGDQYSDYVNISASTGVTIDSPVTNISGTTVIGGGLNISGSGLTTKISWVYDNVCDSGVTDDYTNLSTDKTITIPSSVGHLKRGLLEWEYGDVHNKLESGHTYDPGDNTSTTACSAVTSEKLVIPKSISHLDEWSNNCLMINNNVCVTGTVTASQGMYTSSDESLKDDIHYIRGEEISRASRVELKSFYYKSDPSRRKVYGVIAQDVERLGLEELVHYDNDGIRSVDYTGLLLLKIAALEKEISILKNKFDEQK